MTKYKHLTEKDLEEGKQILEMFEVMDETAKKIALVYLGALSDIAMLEKQTA